MKQFAFFVYILLLCLFPTIGQAKGYCKDIRTIARYGYYAPIGRWGVFSGLFFPEQNGANDIAADTFGNIFFADYNWNVIRKLDMKTGAYTVIAGNGSGGYGTPAVTAGVNRPSGITVDKGNNIVFLERFTGTIKRINQATGLMELAYKIPNIPVNIGYYSLAIDQNNVIHYAIDGCIYKVLHDAVLGDYSVKIVGNPDGVTPANGKSALEARLNANAMAFDQDNKLFFADGDLLIWVVGPDDGLLYNYAGGQPVSSSDSIPARSFRFQKINDLAFDKDNNLLITDNDLNYLVKVNAADTSISIVTEFREYRQSGGPYPYGSTTMALPQGIGYDAKSGDIFVVSHGQYRIKQLRQDPAPVPEPFPVGFAEVCQYTKDTLPIGGTDLTWYKTSVGGIGIKKGLVPNTSKVDTQTYFVSQTIGGKESPRSFIWVMIDTAPQMPVVHSPLHYCVGEPTDSLAITRYDSTSLLKWYADSLLTKQISKPLPSSAQRDTFRYYVAGTYPNRCKSLPGIAEITIHKPDIPVVDPIFNLCQGRPVPLVTAQGENIHWYQQPGEPGSISAPELNSKDTGAFYYLLTQTDPYGCTSDTASIIVKVHPTAAIPKVASPLKYCQWDTALPLSASGTLLKWYTSDSLFAGDTPPIPYTGKEGTFTSYVRQTNEYNCESDLATIQVTVNAKPSLTSSSELLKPRTGYLIHFNASSDITQKYLWNTGFEGDSFTYIPAKKGPYSFWVISISDKGCISDTVHHQFDIDADKYWLGSIDIYPSPFTNAITVTGLNLSDIYVIRLRTTEGIVVAQSEIPAQSYTLNVPEFIPSGFYIVEVKTLGRANPSKIVFKK